MSTINAITMTSNQEGIFYPCELTFRVNSKGKLKTPHGAAFLRPYMLLDLLSEVMPKWMFTDDITVQFGHTKTSHYNPIISEMSQPCLIVTDGEHRETKYLLNKVCDVSWLTTIYPRNLAAMVLWWRSKENRDLFLKPIQQWEWEKIDDSE